ncbi:MAG: hypothetical protein R2758_12540 [Bacteroidales bacterium]
MPTKTQGGEIYYNIKYVSNPSSLSTDLLPKELVIAFRNDLISTTLKAPIGNSGITTVEPEGEYLLYIP